MTDFDPTHFLSHASIEPGVYKMFDADGKVLYIGKARNLKKRLSSYFRKNLTNKTAAMMLRMRDIQTTITRSETEALLLEANLIKEHRPPFNILLRDDKSYPYLYISADEFPRLSYYRGAKVGKGQYFGPYPGASAARETLYLLQKLFKLRTCDNSVFSHRSRPCLQYQIKRCTAPCVGKVSSEEYAEQVQHVQLFLSGKSQKIIHELEQDMDRAAEALQYERAAECRDLIADLRRVQAQQFIDSGHGDIDVLAIAQGSGRCVVSLLSIRQGRLLGHKNLQPKVPKDTVDEDVLLNFIAQYYLTDGSNNHLPEKIVLPFALKEQAWLQQSLREKAGHKVQLLSAGKQQYQQWRVMAHSNAEQALQEALSARQQAVMRLNALQKSLQLDEPVTRVECFDVSHTQGEATVASCVVYGETGALKKDYRRFNIKDVTAGDDYAALRQALLRRYQRRLQEDLELPGVVVIDGGKGQLKVAAEVWQELQLMDRVVLLAVAKGAGRKPGLEKIYRVGSEQTIEVNFSDEAFHLLQFVRDESHRFAISAHRKQRQKARTQSVLEEVPGVGAKRRQALLKHFGGLTGLKRASVLDIEQVPGINKGLAEKIYHSLH